MEKIVRTVCVCDIVNFLSLFLKLSEESIPEFLDRFYNEMGELIVSSNGMIVKYIGDAILFTFDNAQSAVDCAKKMIERYTRKISKGSDRLSVSVVTGHVFSAEIGHPSLRVRDLFGRTVNHAFTLNKQAAARADGLYICEETARIIGDTEC